MNVTNGNQAGVQRFADVDGFPVAVKLALTHNESRALPGAGVVAGGDTSVGDASDLETLFKSRVRGPACDSLAWLRGGSRCVDVRVCHCTPQFDVLVLALGLLVNCVEEHDANRAQLALLSTWLCPGCGGYARGGGGAPR